VKGWSGKLSRWAKRPAAELDIAAVRLVNDAESAARLRAYRSDPNVAALTIERTRDTLDRWGWTFIIAGLAYTTVNVQRFVAGAATSLSLVWITAWLVEPMVMGLMLVLLRGEQIGNRHGFQAGGWVRTTRWIALGITYVMNTWGAWLGHSPAEIVKHSVPVVLVFMAAEALVQQRLTLSEVVDGLGRGEQPTKATKPISRPAERLAEPSDEQVSSDELAAPRTARERAQAAFVELADEALMDGRPLNEITPKQVDERAGLTSPTAKRQGYMESFRMAYLNREGVADDAITV
jgi:hypothetical protein